MGTVQQHWTVDQGIPPAGRMRVVILEPDPQVRCVLCQVVHEQPEFCLVGECETWTDCALSLHTYLPELLIIDGAYTSRETDSDEVFPVRIELRSVGPTSIGGGAFERLDIPTDSKQVRDAVQRARLEIYRRKLEALSYLFQQYGSYSEGGKVQPAFVRIDGSSASEIPAENVLFIAANGNYIQVHAESNIHEVRDTMSAFSGRLDPAHFSRVHRSFIVNRAHVKHVLRKEGTAVGLELSNGKVVPIGPNYRSEAERFEVHEDLLTA